MAGRRLKLGKSWFIIICFMQFLIKSDIPIKVVGQDSLKHSSPVSAGGRILPDQLGNGHNFHDWIILGMQVPEASSVAR